MKINSSPLRAVGGLLLAVFLGAQGHGATFNVREYGAKGDKTVNDQAALQAAVDACAQAGGGEVLVPAGNYSAGKVILKSGVTLRLEAGATIWATDKLEDYDRPSPGPRDKEPCLIEADGQENIAVVGDGTIVGTGQADLARRTGDYAHLPAHRFGVIHFVNCKNIRLRDFAIRFSSRHTVKFNECENVSVIGLSILNNYLRTETDGIDPISSRNVLISDCHIVAGDDCICPKTERGIPLENLVIDNCILESVATAMKFGTGSSGVYRDVRVSNCVIRNTTIGIGLYIKESGGVERCSFSNISIGTTTPDMPIAQGLRGAVCPILIALGKHTPDTVPAVIHDVSFSDIQIESDHGILIQGMADRPIENLSLRNISFRVPRAFDFSKRIQGNGGSVTLPNADTDRFVCEPTYVALGFIRGLIVDDLRVLINPGVFQQLDGSALAVFGSTDAVISNVQREPAGVAGGQPVISLENCAQVQVTGCLALPGTPVFLGLSGEKTRDISLTGDDLNGAAMPVSQAAGVPTGAVKN